jgi:hypothetical protein
LNRRFHESLKWRREGVEGMRAAFLQIQNFLIGCNAFYSLILLDREEETVNADLRHGDSGIVLKED